MVPMNRDYGPFSRRVSARQRVSVVQCNSATVDQSCASNGSWSARWMGSNNASDSMQCDKDCNNSGSLLYSIIIIII
jgi:hypothetical protein